MKQEYILLRNTDFIACYLQPIIHVTIYERESLEFIGPSIHCWQFELKFVWPPLRTASAIRLKTSDQNEE